VVGPVVGCYGGGRDRSSGCGPTAFVEGKNGKKKTWSGPALPKLQGEEAVDL